jgi:RNA polymerase sigma factor (sigma-70 family)
LAAVPSIGRAAGIEEPLAPEAAVTRSLYEQYANQIFRYCLHQLGCREEAEDAVQSTFLNAFRGIKRGVVPEVESAWLFKIAHNVCLSRRRSAWRRGRVESPADFDLVEELTPAPSRRSDELIGLQDVLEQMPETQRRAILLREWQGLSYREIAEELDVSQAAVETLIFRARRSLAAGLEQPAQPRGRRAVRALDWSNAVAALKSALVGGSMAAKVAATVAVVSATTVAATAPAVHHHAHRVAPNKAPLAPRPVRHHASHAAVLQVAPVSHLAPAASVVKPVVRHTSVSHAPRREGHTTGAQVRAHGAPPSAPVAPAPVSSPAPTSTPTPAAHEPAPPAEKHTPAQGKSPGNGHAYGRAKHAQPEPAPPADSTPATPAAGEPAGTPTVQPPVPVVANAPRGNAYGHDKSGGEPAAPVNASSGD